MTLKFYQFYLVLRFLILTKYDLIYSSNFYQLINFIQLTELQEDFRRKIETFETLKAVAKEIQKKNEELEKEVWMGKGGSKESDPVGAEVLIDQFLFGSQNPYALSNNTKLSVNLRGKDLRIGNSGLEQTVIKEGDMRKIELTDEQQVANQSTIIPRHQLQGYDGENEQVVNFKEFPLYSYFYGRPNFIIFIDHLIKDPNSNINYSTINESIQNIFPFIY